MKTLPSLHSDGHQLIVKQIILLLNQIWMLRNQILHKGANVNPLSTVSSLQHSSIFSEIMTTASTSPSFPPSHSLTPPTSSVQSRASISQFATPIDPDHVQWLITLKYKNDHSLIFFECRIFYQKQELQAFLWADRGIFLL